MASYQNQGPPPTASHMSSGYQSVPREHSEYICFEYYRSCLLKTQLLANSSTHIIITSQQQPQSTWASRTGVCLTPNKSGRPSCQRSIQFCSSNCWPRRRSSPSSLSTNPPRTTSNNREPYGSTWRLAWVWSQCWCLPVSSQHAAHFPSTSSY